MNSIILSIGDELILGQTIDTNSAWISRELAAIGCDIIGHLTVADDQPAIERALRDAAQRCDFLIVSGGIGPTDDDLTRQALAAVLGVELVPSQAWLDRLQGFFDKLNRPMPEKNKIQAMIPRTARMIDNTNGTAAGMEASYTCGHAQHVCRIFVMPGVPKEMKAMFTLDVRPHIAAASGGAVILSRTLLTFGMGESAVAELLGDLMDRRRNPSVGTTVSGGMVGLRVNARYASVEQAKIELESTCQACRLRLGELIFGQDEQSLPEVVGRLLVGPEGSRPRTVTTAESCTGGLLAKMLTDTAGSSTWFHQGWVTYSNQAKYERLGVSMEIINVFGAVSEAVVEAMAKNARRLAKSDFALSISGIAGPDGGSATKPVGTVCIALAEKDPDNKTDSIVRARTFIFPGDRETNRDRAAKMALTMLRFRLLNMDMPF